MKTKGLTIQEAIQSGLPFKRPLDLYFTNFVNHQKVFLKADLLATDWEIKVPEVTIKPVSREEIEALEHELKRKQADQWQLDIIKRILENGVK